ncbi:MAG: phenylalanine--tRNA ligase subunit alpha [Patescibacteria group bacterium]|nr:phenylalanine--tRNA ligase subunit alpha [Patescibacteria group bacterium]
MLNKQLQKLKKSAFSDLQKVKNEMVLRDLELKYFARKDGKITMILRNLSKMSESERKTIGKLANEIKKEIEFAIQKKKHEIQEKKFDKIVEKEKIDTTLPSYSIPVGNLHPITKVQREIEEIFYSMGFVILDGPEIESDYYNFSALNVPSHHPARDMQDTFYVEGDDLLLRTQTSSVQVRAMEEYGAPFKAIVPGRVFRYEASDASHDNTFYQVEGFMIDKDISLANLKAITQEVLNKIFNKKIKLRFRPGYFPFVEPGLELDLECLICKGKGCSVCKKSGWIEFMGAGMIHPNVFKAGKIDPKKWQGFAFGFGLTRLVMMKYGIDDIRLLMSGDLRFLKQF